MCWEPVKCCVFSTSEDLVFKDLVYKFLRTIKILENHNIKGNYIYHYWLDT